MTEHIMFAVLGENDSDAKVVKYLIWQLAGNKSIRIKTKGFDGKSRLLSDGARSIEAFQDVGETKHYIVCVDADGPDPTSAREQVMRDVIRRAGVQDDSCCVVPVQEIEAWILADIEAVTKVISSWKPTPVSSPESIASPKEYLARASKTANKKPRYAHAVHNEKVAQHLNTDKLYQRCLSFRILADYIRSAFPR